MYMHHGLQKFSNCNSLVFLVHSYQTCERIDLSNMIEDVELNYLIRSNLPYSDHSRETEKVAVIDRWPLFTGSLIQ